MRLLSWARRVGVAAAAIVAACAILLALLHAPFVRARALTMLAGRLADAGVVARADELDYNLLTLSVRMTGVSVATPGAATTPFFTAKEIRASLPWAILAGRIAINSIDIVSPAVTLRRDAQGHDNWTIQSAARSSASPPSIHIARLIVRDLAVDWTDEQQAAHADAALSLDLIAKGGATSGSIVAPRPARVRFRDRATSIALSGGQLAWNDRDLSLALSLTAAEGAARIDARIADLLGTAGIDARIDADAHLEAVSPWARLDRALPGTAHASVHVTGTNVEITNLTARVAGGEIDGKGQAAFGGAGALHLGWRDLDLPSVLGQVPAKAPRVLPASMAAGTIDAQWSEPSLDALRANLKGSLAAHPVKERPSDPPVDAALALELRGRRWTLTVDRVEALGARVVAALDGTLDPDDLTRSTLAGRLNARTVGDEREWVRALVRAGWLDTAPPVSGTASADFVVSGMFGAPSLDGDVSASVQYEALPAASLRAHASASSDAISLSDVDARIAGAAARGGIRWSIGSDAIAGTLNADLPLASLPEITPTVPRSLAPGGSIDLTTSISGSVAQPRAAIRAAGSALQIAGQTIDRFSAEARVAGADLAVDRLVLEQDAGRVEARGTYDFARRTYSANVSATGVALHPTIDSSGGPETPMSGRLSATFEGSGTLSSLGGRGHIAIDEARWRSADLGAVGADLTLAGRGAAFTFRAGDLALEGRGTASIDPDGPVSMTATWAPADVAALARRMSVDLPLTGSAEVAFDWRGTRDRLADGRGSLRVDRADVTLASQRFQLVQAGRIDADGGVLRVTPIAIAAGASRLTIDGAPATAQTPPRVSLTLDGSLDDLAFVRQLTQPQAADEARPWLAGAIRAQIVAEGTTSDARLSASLAISEGRIVVTDGHAVTGIDVGARYDGGVLTVERATAAFEGASLSATARVPSAVFIDEVPAAMRRYLGTSTGPATLSAQLRSVTQSAAAPFVDAATLEQLALHAEATIDLEADRLALDSVRGTIAFPRADLALSGISFDQQVPTRLAVRDSRITVEAFRWGQGDNQLVIQGGATLAADPALALSATAALDLRTVNALTRAVRTIGRGDAEIRVGGTAHAPTLDGYLTVSNAEARVADPRMVVSDINGTITFARDIVTFERLSATANGGDAELAGSIRLRQLMPADGSVTLTAKGVMLDIEGVRAETDAALTWSIDNAISTLGGSVTLLRSSYREPLTVTSGLMSALRGSSAPIAAAPGASLLDRTRLDVRIVTDDDLLIENNLGRLNLRGDLRAVGTVAKPSLTGRATIAEGGQVFFNGMRYRFEKDGSIDFANPNRVEPDFDLDVTARVQGIDITLTLNGTPAALEHTLQSPSNPELSQSDLVSLLLLGRTASSGDALIGSDDLVGLVAGGFIETAGRAIGLDTARIERGTPDVRLDAGLVAAETDPGARLTFGKTIGTRWDVVLSQSLQQSGGLTWIVGFKPRTRIDLRVVSLDDGDRFYTFSHDLTFGGPQRRATAAVPPAPRVARIDITGAGPDEAALRSRLKLKEGDRFSFFEAQDDRERIEAFYRVRRQFEARVSSRRESDPADPLAVRLVYRIRPGPPTTVVVDGYELSKSGAAAIDRAWQGAVADDFLMEEAADAARVDLAAAGYMQPSVTARMENSANAKQLRVTIAPGPHVTERRVEFSGNETQTAERLRAVLAERGLTRTVWTDAAEIRDALTNFYKASGYLNASVRVDPIAISGNAAIRPIHVDEGGPFQVASVRVEGSRAITAGEAAGIIGLAAGSRYTESGLEQAQQVLDAQYRARGYNRVRIDTEAQTLQNAATHEVAVVIRVDEGPQQRLREIVTDGVTRTRPSLVSRALKLEVGEPVDLAAWNAARRRIYETGAFRNVDIQRTVIETPAAGQAEEPVRATVTVQEWPPLRVRYGLEVRDELNAAGDAARANVPEAGETGGRTFGFGLAGQLDTRGLFGTAISAGVAGRYAPNTRASRVYLTSPSFFGRPITSTVFAERSLDQVGSTPDSNIKPFETAKTDFTFEQRIRTASRTTVSYLYTFERNHTRELEPDPLFPIGDVTVSIGKFAGTFVFDTRDDLSDATRGLFHSSTAQYAPDKLGSDLRFLKYFVQQRYYRKVGRIVVATSAQLGVATAFDTTLVPDQRFFAGGGNSVRGYDEDVLSPTDLLGAAVGGNALFVLNQEVRFPVFKYLRGVGFFDAGRAFERVSDLSLGGLAPSAGFGLRVYTPFVLLRVDAGIPFDAAFGPRRTRWFFSIGQMF
jgi:outer membrane protein assembly factor BamA/autotransporter translocation and assembly factor TamB